MTSKTRTRLFSSLLFIGLILAISFSPLLSVPAGRAQGPDTPRKPLGQPTTFDQSDASIRQDDFEGEVTPSVIQPRTEGIVNIIVVLEEPPAAEIVAMRPDLSVTQAANVSRNQMARVEAAQTGVRSALSASGVNYDLMGVSQRVLSSLIIRADSSQLEMIQNLPGVKRAYIEPVFYFENATSVRFIGAPTAWTSYTGAGIRIGIIDSGVDYLHADFGDPITGNPYTAFPNAKIAGGYDFVGDAWNPDPDDPAYSPALVPDNDPMDQNGHGTHVAGTAAGFGVTSTGDTYGGPWNNATPFATMRVGPGVAPEATLYALKVGAVTGFVSSSATILALDWATDPNNDGNFSDHLDVVNMSIGRSFGTPDDDWATATNNAAQLGVAIATSAGNSGDTYFITGTPGAADWAVSTASSLDGSPAYEVTAPAGIAGIYRAGSASFGPTYYDVTAQVQLVNDGTAPITNGCEPLAGFTPGRIALIDRGLCGYTTKVYNAQLAGAVGVIIANTASGSFGGLGYNDGDPLVSLITIPSVMATFANANTLKANLAAGLFVHMNPNLVYGPTADITSSFSSRGPQHESTEGDVALKPDLTAPGDAIISAARGTVTGGVAFGGTSMASPHVTGTLALLRQQHPTWTVAEIKALVMNTATHNLYQGLNQTGNIYGPARRGAGRVNVINAVNSEVIAYNTDNPELVSVSFGILDVTGPAAWTKTITVENKGGSAVSYDVSYVGLGNVDGVSYSVSPNAITVAGGSTETITVTLTAADPNTWNQPHSYDPTVSEYQALPRHWLSEESGLVRMVSTTSGEPDLWVALYAAPRPASDLEITADPYPLTGVTGSATLDMIGTGIDTGTAIPYDVQSLISAFELYYESDDDPPVFAGQSDAADLRYVGITSDYPAVVAGARPFNNTHVYFGIATYENWVSPSQDVRFNIFIDSNQDGTADYRVFNWNIRGYYSKNSRPGPLDSFVVFIDSTNPTDEDDDRYDWYRDYVNFYPSAADGINFTYGRDSTLFETNVMVIPVWASLVGLTSTDAAFNWWIESKDYLQDVVVETSPVFTYDLNEQTIDFSNGFVGSPTWIDQSGPAVPIAWNWLNYVGPADPCILLLHHHNPPGLRQEVVCLQTNFQYDLSITKTADPEVASETEVVNFTVTATNNDPTYTYPVTVEDTLDPEFTYYSHTASQGTFNPGTGIWDVGDLGPGASAVLTLRAQVAVGTAGQLIGNRVEVRNALGLGTDSLPGNNVAGVGVEVRGGGTPQPGTGAAGALGLPSLSAFDPALSKVGALEPGGIGLPGEQITWTISVTNNGTATAYNVPLVDTIRPEMRLDSADISKGSVAISGQTVNFTIPSLAPGETVTARIYTTVLTSPFDGLFSNEVSIVVPDGAGGSLVLRTARATVSGVGTLPSTGYPPDKPSGMNPWWIVGLAAMVALALTIGGLIVRRRMKV